MTPTETTDCNCGAMAAFAAPSGSDIWRDHQDKPAIGEVVENQDGSPVMWCGVNWWHATLWRTMTVTRWRHCPNVRMSEGADK